MSIDEITPLVPICPTHGKPLKPSRIEGHGLCTESDSRHFSGICGPQPLDLARRAAEEAVYQAESDARREAVLKAGLAEHVRAKHHMPRDLIIDEIGDPND